jgi:hypothetical protein
MEAMTIHEFDFALINEYFVGWNGRDPAVPKQPSGR